MNTVLIYLPTHTDGGSQTIKGERPILTANSYHYGMWAFLKASTTYNFRAMNKFQLLPSHESGYGSKAS